MNSNAKNSLQLGLVTYLLCIAVPVGCKLLGLASFSWWWAWLALWAPMAFTSLFVVVTLVAKVCGLLGRKEPVA